MAEKTNAIGRVVQVIGPVLDVQFEAGHLPAIYNAVRITSEGFNVPEPLDVIAEVQQHLGEGRVRASPWKPTEGMVRGMKAVDHGRGHHRSRGPRNAGPRDERARRARGSARPSEEPTSTIRFTVRRRRSKSSPPRSKCLRPASRSST